MHAPRRKELRVRAGPEREPTSKASRSAFPRRAPPRLRPSPSSSKHSELYPPGVGCANVRDPVESRYRILERIDSGGMAEVFKGRARAIHGIEKTVAIKRILPHLARNRKFVSMFLDEARLSVYLNHANIVQVFDIARSAGNYFIVMEYVEGSNLRTLLDQFSRQNRSFPVEHAAYVAANVCRALGYAHDRLDFQGRPLHIVHRDVSPPNVLLTVEGEVKLVDFGLARAASQLEKSDPDILKGKLGYMSPEQAWGKEVDRRADIFATGILLFEMLAGRRLFRGESDLETLELVRAARLPSLRTLNPRVPEALEVIAMKALTRDPRDRYQDARVFEDALWDFLFSTRLKVTPMTLAAWMHGELLRIVPEPESEARAIDRMIYEEMLKITSIESYDLPEDPDPTYTGNEGSKPISLEDLTVAVAPRRALAMPPPPVAESELGGLTEMLEPETEEPLPPLPPVREASASYKTPPPRPAPKPISQPLPMNSLNALDSGNSFNSLSNASTRIASAAGGIFTPAPRAPGRSPVGWWILAVLVLAGLGTAVYFLLQKNQEGPRGGAAPTEEGQPR